MSNDLPHVEGATVNLRCMLRYQHPLSKLRAHCVNYFKGRIDTEDKNNTADEIGCSNYKAVYFAESKLSFE